MHPICLKVAAFKSAKQTIDRKKLRD